MSRSCTLCLALPLLLGLCAALPALAQDGGSAIPAFSSGPYAGCGMGDGFWEIAPEELAVLYPDGAQVSSVPAPAAALPEGLVLQCSCVVDVDGDASTETVGLIGTPLEGDFPIMEQVRLVVLAPGDPTPRAMSDPVTVGDYEEAYAGAHLFVADVDGDGKPEILLRGWIAGASARPTTLTIFRYDADGPALESIGNASGEMDVVIADYDGDGALEFVGGGSIGWEIPHVCAPRWTTIWGVREGALTDVSADFPEQAGAPMEDFEALFALKDLDSDPRKDCEIRYYLGLRYELDGNAEKAVEWYRLAVEAYDAAIAEWKRLVPDEEPTYLVERRQAAEDKAKALSDR